MIKLKKMMKKWLLSGCLLTLMACGQVPQERIDSLKETIADYEENGAGAEMPEEFRALQESFAEVERSVEAEKEKMFSSYSAVEQKMAQIEKQLDDMAFTINARSDRFQKVYKKFAREVSLGLLMYASLPKDKARSLPKEMKDDLQRALQPALLLRCSSTTLASVSTTKSALTSRNTASAKAGSRCPLVKKWTAKADRC